MGIQTFSRFVYINAYAFLLLFLCVCIVTISLLFCSGILFIIFLLLALLCCRMAIKIFTTWPGKIRHYHKLMAINISEFSPDSFKNYIQVPCGRLLTRVVLKDLGKSDRYPELLKLRLPLLKRIRSACEPRQTIVFVRDKENLLSNDSSHDDKTVTTLHAAPTCRISGAHSRAGL